MVKRVSPIEGRTIRGNLRYLEELRELARKNRQSETKTENIMWSIVRDRKLGCKFTRQKPIGRFVVDFYCAELLLAVEIDGDYHIKRKNYDEERDKYLGWRGIRVVRYKNEDVKGYIEKVRANLLREISVRLKSLA